MRKMSSITAAAILAAGALGAASPASAAIIINVGGNTDMGETVQFGTQQNNQTVTGFTNQSNTGVSFTNTLGLQTGGIGQAVVTNSNTDVLTGVTTVDLAGAALASYIEFNIPGIPGNPPPSEADTVFIQALSADGMTVLAERTFGPSNLPRLEGNGQNFFNITGTDGSTFGGFRITLTPTGAGVAALQNVRVTSAIPEPTTWAMMLIGFGAVGYSMRRRKVSYGSRQLV
jgi:hypothetical protein